jgi:hypothetical protein
MKNIFWAHSPIGYEVFRSFRDHKLTDESDSLLITSRNFHPPDADCTLGLPEEYMWMDEIQVKNATSKISELFSKINESDYILYIPQTANFFIRCLIESPQCLGFYIFDEGTSARGALFQRRVNYRSFYKYEVTKTPSLTGFFDLLNITHEIINNTYTAGVPFYELKHEKLLGFMSHFEKAFPEKNVTKILKANISGSEKCNEQAIILMPPFHALIKKEDFNIRLQNLVNSVKTIKMLDKSMKMVIKFHPHDGDEVASKVTRLFDAVSFDEFCAKNKLSKFREPAFMGFKIYIGYPNSTIEFIKEVGGNYIAF